MSTIERLTQAKAKVDGEVQTLTDAISKASDAIRQEDAVLCTPYSYPEHRDAQGRKSEAWHRRNELTAKLNSARTEANEIGRQLSEHHRYLIRANYNAVTSTAITEAIGKALAGIAQIDSRIADLRAERARLEGLHNEASVTHSAVDSLAAELQEARDALQAAQAEAFIQGTKVDEHAHTVGISKIEKRFTEARKSAESARAALPAISARLADLAEQESEEQGARGSAVRGYFELCERLLEIEYKQRVDGLAETLNQMAAIGRITGNKLAKELWEGLRGGLLLPVLGKHTERFTGKMDDAEIAKLATEAKERLADLLATSKPVEGGLL